MTAPIRLKGIVPPLATPLTAEGALDLAGLHTLVEHELAGGVSGVFILGTTGEGPHLDPALRGEVVTHACREVSGRIPVLVGLCDSSTTANLRFADFAAAAGASALVLTPPFYMPLSQDELLAYLERLVPALPLPVYLYNIPGLTKIQFAPATVKRAFGALPIAGLKDSSNDLAYFAAVRAELPRATGFQLFCGPEEVLLEAIRLGADGGVCGGANLFPRLYVDLYEHATHGRYDDAAALQQRIRELSACVYAQTSYATSYLRGLKAAMGILGICQPHLAAPLAPLPEACRLRIGDYLSGFAGHATVDR